MPPVSVALSTGSIYTYGTARAFELASRAGFDGVELIVEDRWDTRQVSYLRRQAEDQQLPVLSLHSPFAGLQLPGWPRDEVERVALSLALAEELGARVLNLHVPMRVRPLSVQIGGRRWRWALPGATPEQRAYAEWLVGGGLAELQATTDVSITVENLPVRKILGRRYSPYALNTWNELAQFPRVCLDTTHTGTTGADLLAVYERLADRTRHIHLSNYNGRYQHQPIERGYLPLAEFLESVARHQYDGIVVLELTPQALPVHDEQKLLEELKDNLAFCRQHLGQAAYASAAAEGPGVPA